MQVSVETPGGLERRLKVQVPAERVDEAVEARVKRAGKHAKVPGFRPGKAPMKVLIQRYGDQARQEAVSDIIQSTYGEALQQSELKPAGQPNIEVGQLPLPGQALEYTAVFDVYPEIAIKGLDKLKVEQPETEITDADVDKTLDSFREQHKRFDAVERPAQEGDEVNINFEGKLDGEAFEGGKGEDFDVVLGAGRLLETMEKGIVGHAPGETFEVDVDFPEDYPSEDLKGKTAQFTVTLNKVAEAVLPELDDEFAKTVGVAEGGIDALREKVREGLAREKEKAVKNSVKQQIMDELLKANEVECPRGLVAQEMDNMRREAAQRLPEQMRQDAEKIRQLMPDEIFKEGAERRVALGLLIAEVIRDRNIELDDARVDAVIADLSQGYEKTEEVATYYRSNPQIMQGIQAMAMEEQVVDSLLETARVKTVAMGYEELMQSQQQGSQA